jgi:hypothetical protein
MVLKSSLGVGKSGFMYIQTNEKLLSEDLSGLTLPRSASPRCCTVSQTAIVEGRDKHLTCQMRPPSVTPQENEIKVELLVGDFSLDSVNHPRQDLNSSQIISAPRSVRVRLQMRFATNSELLLSLLYDVPTKNTHERKSSIIEILAGLTTFRQLIGSLNS